jgi:hypothetical protein
MKQYKLGKILHSHFVNEQFVLALLFRIARGRKLPGITLVLEPVAHNVGVGPARRAQKQQVY